jgi:hypothetical protein
MLKNVVYLVDIRISEYLQRYICVRMQRNGLATRYCPRLVDETGLKLFHVGWPYIVNQKAPTKRPRFFISVVIWTMLRETLTHAAAHAYDLSSIVLPEQCLRDT